MTRAAWAVAAAVHLLSVIANVAGYVTTDSGPCLALAAMSVVMGAHCTARARKRNATPSH